MALSDASIRRPILATMMNAALIVFGLIGLTRLPVRELPDVDPPIVTVTTIYTGANAAVIETEVTEPLEEALASIEGIKTLTSESREQVSSITVQFDLSRPIEIAAQDVRDRVARVRGRLPNDLEEPIIAKQDADAQPVMWIALFSDTLSTLELTALGENQFKDRLQAVKGVSSVILGGAKRFAIRLWLDSGKMAAHRVTILDVQNALRAQSVELPSGRVESLQRELAVELQGQLKTPEEYNQLVVAQSGATLVRLRDIGFAAVGVEDERSVARFNSRQAIGLGVVKQSKANTIEVARGIKQELARIKPLLPPGVQTAIPYDESIYVERSIREVWETLGLAFILVVLSIWIFLRNFRSTLIPGLAIPVSITATFGILYLLGYSINIVTMLAFVLVIGVVVDDAIVVLENIYRHVEEGMPPYAAAVQGMKEITFAVIATTFALIAVFLPMAFQTSITGRLFIEFAMTISCAVAVSAFVALTLAPMISARLLRRNIGQATGLIAVFERLMQATTRSYDRTLRQALRHPRWIVAAALLSLGLGVFFYTQLPREFLPDEDKGRLFCFAIAPEGSTSEYTDRMVGKMEQIIRATPEVEGYFSAVALARGGPGKASEGLAFIRLKDGKRRQVRDIVQGPRGLGSQFFNTVEGAIAIPIVPKAIGFTFGQPFRLVLQGMDLNQLNAVTQEVANGLRAGGDLLNVRPTFELNKPELRVTIDRDRAATLGISIEDISRTLQILFGGLDINKVNLQGKEYDVIAQLERASRLTPQDLERLYVRSSLGDLVQLSSVVQATVGGGPSAITHYNRMRSATIEATPAGVPLGTAVTHAEALLRRTLPPGFQYEWAGEAKDLQEASKDTLFVLVVALLVIYMVLASQFESLLHPLTVMLTVPLAAIGAFGALWLCSQIDKLGTMLYGWAHYAPNPPAIAHVLSTLIPRIPAMGINLFSQIGMILLLGLVTKNGILLVDFANQQVAQGKSPREAMLAAGSIRLRPILMTALSTIAGMIPIAVGFGAGAESRRPLGMAAIGGMTTSMILTLFVVPVIYVLLSEAQARWQRRAAKIPVATNGRGNGAKSWWPRRREAPAPR